MEILKRILKNCIWCLTLPVIKPTNGVTKKKDLKIQRDKYEYWLESEANETWKHFSGVDETKNYNGKGEDG